MSIDYTKEFVIVLRINKISMTFGLQGQHGEGQPVLGEASQKGTFLCAYYNNRLGWSFSLVFWLVKMFFLLLHKGRNVT
jgi:hypothetical protein